MASSFQQTVSDFDLNFLDQSNDSVFQVPLSKYERARKAILCLKKKTVATTFLIQKFYDKKELVEIRERQVLAAKEECRQLSIQYKDAEDRNNQLQRENALLQAENKEIMGKYVEQENQYEAMKSYCNQLQSLAQENETRIQSMVLETNLEKSDTKVNSKKVTTLQKDNEELIRNILLLGEVVLGTRKASKKDKAILDKCRKLDVTKLEALTEEETEDSDNDVFEDAPSSPAYETTPSDVDGTSHSSGLPVVKTDALETASEEVDRDSDSGAEVTSNDTGRGSSLAFSGSGSDKCLPSPDYFINDSPFSAENEKTKPKTTHVDIATSPIKIRIQESESHINFDKIPISISSQTRSPSIVDVATSPINRRTSNRCTSPIEFNNNNVERQHSIKTHMSLRVQSGIEFAARSMKDASAITNDGCTASSLSEDTEENTYADSEIEMILTNMRMSHELITPIPTSPSKSRQANSRNESSALSNEHTHAHCPDVEKIREENIALSTKLTDLEKEVMTIKNLLVDRHNNKNAKKSEEHNSLNIENSEFRCSPLLEINDNALMDIDDRNTIMLNENNKSNTSAMGLDSNQFDDSVDSSNSQSPMPDISKKTNSGVSVSTKLQANENKNRSEEVNINYRRMSAAIVFESDTEDYNIPTSEELPPKPEIETPFSSTTNNSGLGNRNRSLRPRKLTRLQKFKKHLIPKNKIKCSSLSSKRLSGKSRLLVSPRSKNTSTKIQSSKHDSQIAYEKAVKIMAELRSKEKDKARVGHERKLPPRKAVSSSNRNIEPPKDLPADITPTEISNDDESDTEMPRRRSINVRRRINSSDEESSANRTRTRSITTRSLRNSNDNESAANMTLRRSITTRSRQNSNDDDDDESATNMTRRRSITTRSLRNSNDNESAANMTLRRSITTRSRQNSNDDDESATNITRRRSITTRSLRNSNDNESAANMTLRRSITTRSRQNSNDDDESATNITRTRSITTRSLRNSKDNDSAANMTLRRSITTRSRQNSNDDDESATNITRSRSITTRSRQNSITEAISPGTKIKIEGVQIARDVADEKLLMKCTVGVTATLIDCNIKDKDTINTANPSSPRQYITRSRNAQDKDGAIGKTSTSNNAPEAKSINSEKDSITKDSESRKMRKRGSLDMLEQNKRVLRSSASLPTNVQPSQVVTQANLECKMSTDDSVKASANKQTETLKSDLLKSSKGPDDDRLTCYDDLDMFGDDIPKKKPRLSDAKSIQNPQDSVLCAMLDKYAVAKMKNNPPKTPPDTLIDSMKKTIEDTIAGIVELPTEQTKPAMNIFVEDIKTWPMKDFMLGLLKYLTDPTRKGELLSKRFVMNSPAMTKPEQVLLYVFAKLNYFWPNVNFVSYLLDNIEYTLFRLNKTPDFETIDSLSHFYAVLCRYVKDKNRLRLFMMDAMYCMQFKAVPLIRQCLDVWMHVLPLAHMGIAKSPLVTSLVYLLHFYKCEDKFNRVQEIRHILNRSYSYKITEWNEPKILEMFRNAIKDHRDVPIEKKMLRMALIILAKRHGPRWCEKHIIKGVLQSIIDDERATEKPKIFCVSMLGPLMKPYPVDMKVNVEVVINQLLDRLDRNVSPQMEEAIITSLTYVSRHNQNKVLQALLRWRPKKLSPEIECLLRDFVRSRPIKGWQAILSKISLDIS